MQRFSVNVPTRNSGLSDWPARASPHCEMPPDRVSLVRPNTCCQAGDIYEADLHRWRSESLIKGGLSWSKDELKASKGSCQSRCGACRHRPAAFPGFRQRPGRAPEPASKAQRDLARSTALGRQFGVRVYGKINRGTFDPGGDVGISGMGHAAASDDG